MTYEWSTLVLFCLVVPGKFLQILWRSWWSYSWSDVPDITGTLHDYIISREKLDLTKIDLTDYSRLHNGLVSMFASFSLASHIKVMFLTFLHEFVCAENTQS